MSEVQVTPIGHATVLLKIGERHLLFDPVFSQRIGVSFGPLTIGSRRLRPPAIQMNALPEIDVVLLSHSHMDHTDLPSLRRLPKKTMAIVQKNNLGMVRRFKEKHALKWGESLTLGKDVLEGSFSEKPVTITATAAKHWGARYLVDQWRGWGGFLIEIASVPSRLDNTKPFSILFAGDTAKTDVFKRLRQQRNELGVDLAIMPIGAYDPWIFNHCSPEQAWQMAVHELGAEQVMPVHYDTFQLSNEPREEPMERLMAIAGKEGALDKLVGLTFGEAHTLV